MKKYTKEDVLIMARDLHVEFVRLQFTDILGIVKNVSLTVERLEKALDGDIMFDGSSIEGFTRIQESDMYLKPDFDTFCVFPWKPGDSSVARLICDVYDCNENAFDGDPRTILKKAIDKLAKMGYEAYAGPEPEFFLFEIDEKGNPITELRDKGGYFDLSPVDLGEDTRRDIVLALKKMNFDVETSHHEVAPGQHEIDFKYTDILRTADNIATFKFVTKIIAKQRGLHATFMPKPIFGEAGSGMHVHLSLHSNDKNGFYDAKGELSLNATAKHFIGGIIKHATAITAIANPTVNSYKRLVPGYEAPVYIAWSGKNRSALIRIPTMKGENARIEIRSPDPSANPYLLGAVLLEAGMDGIKNRIDPGPQTFNNIFKMSASERQQMGIRSLPGSLKEAIEALREDEVIKNALGEHAYKHFVKAKLIEWETYRIQVHDWERDQYITVF